MNIAEVCRRYALTSDTLRYYERIGLIPPVKRTASGLRDYDEEDCKWVEFIKCMRSAGLSIEFLTEYVKLFMQGDDTLLQRKSLILEQRDLLVSRMEEMQVTLDRLNRKVERYEKLVVGKEKELRRSDGKPDPSEL